ncbi:pyridoxal phosphate-dependent transferase [Morchella snyderi]|nr:pyridoxal phosphate-dependent transferase [Morchella snyderi]
MPPKDPKAALEAAMSQTLSKRATLSRLRALSLPPPNSTDFSSNDFLSLASSPLLRQTFLAELSAHPAHPLGSGGSRLLDGNSPYAEALEVTIAQYHNAPCGLLFNSGFDANSGFFSCVPQPGDVIVYDEYIHASVHEGMRASRASRVMFKHNCPASFREVLCTIAGEDREEALRGRQRNVFVAVESLYSMDGDLAPLAELVAIADEVLERGALFTVDEAHATGVVGEGGRGLVSQLGLEQRVFARLHTFGKALACNGAIILTDATTRQYLINYARPLIYTTSLSFPALAAITASYTLLRSAHAAALQSHLHSLTALLHRLLLSSLPSSPQTLTLPPVRPTPILALLTPQPRALAAHLQMRGLVARPIVFPTVPKGTERVRICVHAGNTVADVEALVEAVREWVVERARGSKI